MTRNYFPDDEEIWEELLYFLKNPITKEEELAKKKTESEYIDSVLEKAFSDSPQSNIVSNDSYLSYEDLLDDDSKQIKPLEGYIQKTNLQDPYARIASRDDLTQEQKMEKMAEIARIQNESKENLQNINREHNLAMLKHWGGFGLELGSAFVPGVGGAKLAGMAAKQIAPKVGRKIAKEIADGTLKGISQGAVEGFGRGLTNDENPFKTAAQDSVLGIALGAGGGVVGGVYNHNARVKVLNELLDKRKYWGIAFTKQAGQPEAAIEKLLEQKQGFVPKAIRKSGIGDIDFVWGDSNKGLQHIIYRRNNEGINGDEFVKNIPNLIKNSKVYHKNKHYDRKYIGDGNQEISVKTAWDNKSRNWIVSSYNLTKKAPSQDLSGLRALNQTCADGQQISPSDLQNVPSSSLSNNFLKLNPMSSRIPKIPSFEEWLDELKRKRRSGS